jgi:hypothetical protein
MCSLWFRFRNAVWFPSTDISTEERRNNTLVTAKWVSPDWCVVFLLSRNNLHFAFSNLKPCSKIHTVQQQTAELSERSFTVEATRREWNHFGGLYTCSFTYSISVRFQVTAAMSLSSSLICGVILPGLAAGYRRFGADSMSRIVPK